MADLGEGALPVHEGRQRDEGTAATSTAIPAVVAGGASQPGSQPRDAVVEPDDDPRETAAAPTPQAATAAAEMAPPTDIEPPLAGADLSREPIGASGVNPVDEPIADEHLRRSASEPGPEARTSGILSTPSEGRRSEGPDASDHPAPSEPPSDAPPQSPAQAAPRTPPPPASEEPFPAVDQVEYDHDAGSSGVLRLRPTCSQWADFPAILSTARGLGAEKDGCFKVVLPDGLLGPMPDKPAQRVPANAYRTRLMDRTRFWQVSAVPTEGNFPASSEDRGMPQFGGSVDEAFAKLRTLFTKNKDRQMRDVRYRVDVPAWTPDQRRAAGVPDKSPLHPLRGDRLDRTRAIIPGIHTPYVYESGPAFGAAFQIHAEDFRLSSLNHLYRGRKIWVVIPSPAVDLAEEKLGRRGKCSQFMRHRAEFVFPSRLDRLGTPYRVVDQRPGETIVILPDAYHEGFSTGYTLAEAKNYAEPSWSPSSYQPCDARCNLPTAIPAQFMELVGDADARLDLCRFHEAEDGNAQLKRKRDSDDVGDADGQIAAGVAESEAQKPRLSSEVVTTV